MKGKVSAVWAQPPAIRRRHYHILKFPTCHQKRSKEKVNGVPRPPWMAKCSENSVHNSWDTERCLVLESEYVVQTCRVGPSNLRKQRLIV